MGYYVTSKILFAAHYGAPQERWRLILIGSRYAEVAAQDPTHYATGRANFRGGGTLTFQLTEADKKRLLPAVTAGEAIGDLPRLQIGEGAVPTSSGSRPSAPFQRFAGRGVNDIS